MSTLATISAVAMLSLSSATMLGMQGPGDGKEGKSPERTRDPKVTRAQLMMRIEESKRLQDRLQAAVDRIDKGESAELPAADRVGMRQERQAENWTDRAEHKDGQGSQRVPPETLSTDEREKLFAFVQEQMPAAAKRLSADSVKDPEVRTRVLTRFAPKIRDVIGLRTSDPKLFSLRVDEMRAGFEVFTGARDLSEAVHAKKAETETAIIEAAIKEAIGRRFDAQLAAQRLELESLGERVEHLKAEIDRKSSNRDASVNEEAAKLIERARKFDPSAERPRRGHKPEDGKPEQGKPASEPKTGGR